MKLIQLFIQQVFDEYLLLDIVPGSEYFKCMLPCFKQQCVMIRTSMIPCKLNIPDVSLMSCCLESLPLS